MAQRPLAALSRMCASEGVSRTSSPADVTRQRLLEEAWPCSAAAEKYDMGMSERERGRDSLTGINGSTAVWTENLRTGSNETRTVRDGSVF